MPFRRLLLLPVLAGLTACVAGAISLQTARPHSATAPPPTLPLRADSAAAATLDRAVAALAPERPRWLQASVWQHVHVPYLDFQADGSYRSGPGRRLRLDLQVRTDAQQGSIVIVSDGQTLWQQRQVAQGAATVTRVDLGKVLALLARPDVPPAGRDQFLANHFFTGPEPLLRSVRQQVTFTRQDRVRWRDRDAWLLTGARHDLDASLPCEHYFPRQCRVYLDAATLWPHRLEWWGPAPKKPGDILLSEMELRSPVFDQRLPEKEFAYQPGNVPVTDATAQWTQTLTPAK